MKESNGAVDLLPARHRIPALDAVSITALDAKHVPPSRGRKGYGKPTESPSKSIGRYMNTKTVIASYAVELTEDEKGCQWITATRLEPSGDCFVQRAIATSLDISKTSQKLSNAVQSIFVGHLRYRC